uniref:U3 small nucleolar RNA-associated protein 13 C-terminal domain-containing protein n=1 Tax=Electrophorus electricus TaxID=8005 RepID=A0A4W4GVE9_ELEEL
MAGNTLRFKTNYAVSSKIEPFYKGGKVQISNDEQYIFCTCGPRVNVLQISTGKIVHSFEQKTQHCAAFSFSLLLQVLVTASKALMLKQWAWKQDKCTRSWRAIHNVPVASMAFDCTSTLLATGGCDSTIKIWDVVKQYCTHNLKCSSGVVHLVQFHPDINLLQLFSSSVDCGICIWDLRTSKRVCVLESHFSLVTSLAFSLDGHTLISSGRDKICTVWDLKERTVKRTVPVYEAVEGVIVLPENKDYSQLGVKSPELHFVTAGSKGVLRVWHCSSARCVFAQTPTATAPLGLVHCLLMARSARIAAVTAEHNVLLYQLPYLSMQQQFVGYNDDVLDVKFLGKEDTHIVVATNSSQLKVFDLATSSCQILYGHTDTVLSLDVFKKCSMFASCAKDNCVKVWRMDSETGIVRCVAQGQGHCNAVGSVSCSRLKKNFLVSGSQDCTIKVWDLPAVFPAVGSEPAKLITRITEKAHGKDVNSMAVSPNDKLLASGSQDRTAKLWSLADMSLLGVFQGHRRGIWCVQFSPVDQVLATASADGTVKLWGLHDFSCLKTFEGHDASVLKIIFVSRGTQLVSGGSDGLVKLWTIKTNECVKTFDAHQDKVWALHSSSRDDLVVSGSADSTITVWKVKLVQNHILVFCGVCAQACRMMGWVCVCVWVCVESLLRYCVVWNTNARNCLDAQAVLQVLLTHLSPEELLQLQGVRTHLEGLIPYTERHMQRVGRLLQASMFLDYMWRQMRKRTVTTHGQEDEDDYSQESVGANGSRDVSEDEESVGAAKGASAPRPWLRKESGPNRPKTTGHEVLSESSEEDDDDDDVMEISTRCPPTQVAAPTSCILTEAS